MSSISSSRMRITGSSGMDVESMVTQLMRAESMKLDTAKQKLTKLTWKQEAYRETANSIRAFRDTYLSFTVPKTNFRSTAMFNAMKISTTSAGSEVKGINVTSLGSAKPSEHTINVEQIAQSDVYVSSGNFGSDKTASKDVNTTALKQGDKFDVTLDGVTKTIELKGSFSTDEELLAVINEELELKFGKEQSIVKQSTFSGDDPGTGVKDYTDNKVFASLKDGKLTFQTAVGGHVLKLSENASQEESSYKVATISFNIDKIAEKLNLNDPDDLDESSGSAGVGRSGNLTFDFTLKVNDEEFEITISDTITKGEINDALVGALNDKFRAENKPYTASLKDGSIVITDTSNGGTDVKVEVADGNEEFLEDNDIKHTDRKRESVLINLGFSAADLETTSFEKQTIDSLFEFTNNDPLEITINDQTIKLTKDMTVTDLIAAVNDSDANVKMSYNSLTGKIKLEGKETGTINKIEMDDDFKKAFGLVNDPTKGGRQAQDAVLTIDGIRTSRSSNSFEFEEDGLKITLTDDVAFNTNIKISATKDTDAVVENIKTFIEQYNTLLELLQGKTSEQRAKSSSYNYYEPLTDEEKSAISEKDAELWEAKAKEGLLYRDDTINKVISDMRTNMFKSVDLGDNKSISLYDIGISSADWRDKGKLTINEKTLRAALEERPDDIVKLFTQSSDILMSDTANRNQRLNEEGLSERLNDIIDDAIRVSLNSAGRRGTLVEKAGEKNSASESENYMYDQIKAQSDRIDKMIDALTKKEDYYYKMFSAMESAMNKSNSQMDYLAQQIG